MGQCADAGKLRRAAKSNRMESEVSCRDFLGDNVVDHEHS